MNPPNKMKRALKILDTMKIVKNVEVLPTGGIERSVDIDVTDTPDDIVDMMFSAGFPLRVNKERRSLMRVFEVQIHAH